MTPELLPYQLEAIDFLSARKKAYLSLDCGLGKTAVILRTILRKSLFPLVVVCPAMAREHWVAEADKWIGMKADALPTDKIKGPFKHSNIKIISYDAVPKFLKWSGGGVTRAVVFDEAHLLKTPSAVRTKHCLLLKDSLAARTENIYFLSGTPAPNHAGELWPALKVCGMVPEKYSEFVEKYCTQKRVWIPGGRSIQQVSGTNILKAPELKRRMKDVVFRRTERDVGLQLPVLRFSDHVVSGDDTYIEDQGSDEESKWREFFSGEVQLSQLEALSGSIAGLRRIHSLRKIRGTVDLIAQEQIEKRHKLVVFAHHTETIGRICAELVRLGIKADKIYGGTIGPERERVRENFQNGDLEVLVASIGVCSTAINLYAASRVLFVDMDYVPGNNHQAIARVRRMGQKADSIYARWITLAESFVDRRISEILGRKTLEIASLMGG